MLKEKQITTVIARSEMSFATDGFCVVCHVMHGPMVR